MRRRRGLRGGRGSDGRAAPATLYDEIREVCAASGHPREWQRHTVCPCCSAPDVGPLFEKLGIEHWMCAECRFVFVNPYPPDRVLEELYSGHYYTAVRRFIEAEKVRQGRADAGTFSVPVDILERIIERATAGRVRGRWLDVGGGVGAFARLVAARRPGWQVWLHEIDPGSTPAAPPETPVTVLSGTLTELRSRGQRFDVVSSIAVAEHVPHPGDFLARQAALLEPGGTLVVSVPRFSPLNRCVSRANSPNVVPPFHLSLFDEHNLRLLLEREGLGGIVETWVEGPPAFRLIDFCEHWPHWDTLIPTQPRESPKTVQVRRYPRDLADLLGQLDLAGAALESRILEIDGGVYLTVLARPRPAASASSEAT